MWIVILSVFFLLGVLQIVLKSSKIDKYYELSIFAGLLLFFLLLEDNQNGILLSVTTLLILLVGFLVSSIWKTNRVTNIVVPAASLSMLSLLGQSFSFLDREVEFGLVTAFLPFLGFALMFVSNWKLSWIPSWAKSTSNSNFKTGFDFITIGILVFLAYFLAGPFGILLTALGVILYSFTRESDNYNLAYGLLGLALTSVLYSTLHLESSDITIGKNVAALAFGLGASALILQAQILEKHNFSILFLLAALFFIGGLAFGDQINSNFGGAETLIPALIGVSVFSTWSKNSLSAQILIPFILLISTIVPLEDVMENELTVHINKDKKVVGDQEKDPFNTMGLSIVELKGDFSIDEEKSLLNFQLGPKGGVTKGSIKNMKGSFRLDEDVSKCQLSVEMEVIKLTTFNKYRDESLMDPSYFNEAKFPQMKFHSRKWEMVNDYFEVEGDFTMIGSKQKETIKMKYIGLEEDLHVFVGKGSIDRTKYGMTPDSKEGNEVSFEFVVRLRP